MTSHATEPTTAPPTKNANWTQLNTRSWIATTITDHDDQ